MEKDKVSIFDQLYNRLQVRASANTSRVEQKYFGTPSKISSAKKNIQADLTKDLNKLKSIIAALMENKDMQDAFIKMMNYIDSFNEAGITENGILDAILAYGLLQIYFPNSTAKIDDETAYLLSSIMSRFSEDDFEFYGIMVTDPILLENIMKKSSNMNDRRDIMDEVCDELSDFDLDELTEEQYLQYLAEALRIVERTKIGQKSPNR